MCSLRTDLPPVMNVLCVLRGDAQNPTLSPRTQSAPRYTGPPNVGKVRSSEHEPDRMACITEPKQRKID